MFIACLGLFGLTSLAVVKRTKEIGIRKVLGATVANIITLLSRDFLLIVLISNIIAAPIAYLVMRRWLEGFTYKVDIAIELFVLTIVATLILALLTVIYQALRAALADPSKSLRYE
jgi:putative ABC transport system permease protein